MTKIIKAKNKVIRRFGQNLWGMPKGNLLKDRRPGVHGKKNKRPSSFGLLFMEKQKLREYYTFKEKQFKRLFVLASRKPGNVGERFVGILESTLQAFVYRMRWVNSMHAARQLISHGHVKVNGRKVDRRSYLLRSNDVVSLSDKAQEFSHVKACIESSARDVPEYIESAKETEGKFLRNPNTEQTPYAFPANPKSVVEFYSIRG